MRLEFKGGVLTLFIESGTDAAEIRRLFGVPQSEGEFTGDAFGYAVRENKEGNVEIQAALAPWNHGD